MRGWLIYMVQNAEVLVRQGLMLMAASFLVAGLLALGGILWRIGQRYVRRVSVRREMRRAEWAREQAEKEVKRDYPKSSRKRGRAA